MVPLIPVEMTANVAPIVVFFVTAIGMFIGYVLSVRA